MKKDEFDVWFEKQIEFTKDCCWIRNIYWKLEEVSCVLVLRNRKWFEDNISQLEKIWNIILTERETGYDHRAPNRRVKKVEEPENNIQQYFKVGIKQIN